MAEDLFIPRLGQTVEEVTIIQWLVEDGADVMQGQAVVEVETDKAVFPVEANAAGTIHLGPYREGQVVPVLTVVATIGKPGEIFLPKASIPSADGVADGMIEQVPSTEQVPFSAAPAGAVGRQEPFASPRARKLASEEGIDLSRISPTGYGGARVAERDVLAFLQRRPKISPVAQRMAAEAGLDMETLTGSGPGGRILKEDVARATAPHPPENQVRPEVVERIPLKGVRAIVAERLAASARTTARVTLMMEVDASELVTARSRIKERVLQEWGFAPSYTDLLSKIVTVALRRFPYVNARLATDAIEVLGDINLGIAVDTDRGLLVPVIRDADLLSLRLLSAEIRRLSEAARSGQIRPSDLTGGTFTITNLGMYDVDAFTPVINPPEAAILGIGRIAPKVMPYNGEAVIRQACSLSLAFDHRLMDGAPAARFLQSIKQMVEEPYLLLTA